MNEESQPHGDLTSEQQRRVDALSEKQTQIIDKALLRNCLSRWRKVAMVVALTMESIEMDFPGIPDIFYSQRIQRLVSLGLLEAQGNLSRMRFSEVRIPQVT